MVLLLLLSLFTAHATPVRFHNQGQAIPNSEALLARVPQETLKVYEPQEAKIKEYRGYPMMKVFEKIYGDHLKTSDTVSFLCEDGYRADIPLREFFTKKSLLAVAMADHSEFVLKTSKKSIPLAPSYLVWDHPNAQAAKKDVYRWPYAVTQLDVINSTKAYKVLEPKQPTSELQEGKKLFLQHCFSCHTLNDVGGRRGPSLNAVVPTQNEDFLIGYALDPQSFNKGSQMSGLAKDMENRQQAARLIVSYLKNLTR